MRPSTPAPRSPRVRLAPLLAAAALAGPAAAQDFEGVQLVAPDLIQPKSLAVRDLDGDGDGDPDLLVGGRDQGGGRPNFLFRNDAAAGRAWVALALVGDGEHVDRDAFGARVRVTAGEATVVREKKSARGMYNSEDSRWLLFGLGEHDGPVRVHVRWLDGEEATLELAADELRRRWVVTYPDSRTAFE